MYVQLYYSYYMNRIIITQIKIKKNSNENENDIVFVYIVH